MSSPLENQIQKAFAELQEQHQALAGFQQEATATRTTVTTKNRAITVEVDAHGDLLEIKFPSKAYRAMAPAELGALLVATIADARDQARAKAAASLRAAVPSISRR